MVEHVDELVPLLDLEQIESTLFRGTHPKTLLQRSFGGQVLAQALSAAAHTVGEDRSVHSLHAYFLRPGHTDAPIIYDVEPTRDGGSFSSRRVVARQHGQHIFQMSASFQISETGLEHQDPMPEVPDPDDCPKVVDIMSELTGNGPEMWEWGVLDLRLVGQSHEPRVGAVPLPSGDRAAASRMWVRVDGELPDMPHIQDCALAYASDLTLLAAAVVPHDVIWGSPQVMAASLDHAMWFHRPLRADRWWLYDQTSPSAQGGRGLSLGRIFQDGQLVATVAQEGLIRVAP